LAKLSGITQVWQLCWRNSIVIVVYLTVLIIAEYFAFFYDLLRIMFPFGVLCTIGLFAAIILISNSQYKTAKKSAFRMIIMVLASAVTSLITVYVAMVIMGTLFEALGGSW
jgi:hypothetical protein